MIQRITAENFDLSEDLDKYTRNKLEKIGKLLPRKDRATTLVEAIFSEQASAKTCQLTVKLRREELSVREGTQHFYASLDVAAVHIENQLKMLRRQNPGLVRRYLRKSSRTQ